MCGRMILVTILMVLGTGFAGCNPGKPRKAEGTPEKRGGKRDLKIPVELRKAQAYPVEYTIDAIGTVEAFEKVDVVTRVAGVLERITFEEGTPVKTTQVLAEVEPERYRLAVSAARATLEKAKAALAEAESALERRQRLKQTSPGYMSAEEISSSQSKARVLRSELEQARAALDLAELDLKESSVRPPVDGIIQTRLAHTGQYVNRGMPIASLIQRDPLLLKLSVPSVDAPRVRKGMTTRFTTPGHDQTFSAIITHIDEAADASSRMVGITARIDDPNRDLLRPGSFAEVTIPVEGGTERPVIPQAAVRPSERGFLAYIVEKGVARERPVKLGLRTPDGQVEILSGIAPGDLLIVRGAEAVREGSEVTVEKPGTAGAPEGGKRLP